MLKYNCASCSREWRIDNLECFALVYFLADVNIEGALNHNKFSNHIAVFNFKGEQNINPLCLVYCRKPTIQLYE